MSEIEKREAMAARVTEKARSGRWKPNTPGRLTTWGFVCVLLSVGGFYNASQTGEPNWLAGLLLPLGLGMFLVAVVWAVRSRVAPGPRKRREIVAYLAEYSERHGEPPTVPQVAAAVGITESAVEDHVEKLQRAGLIDASEEEETESEVVGA